MLVHVYVHYVFHHNKPESQYDTGAASVVSIMGKSVFFTSQNKPESQYDTGAASIVSIMGKSVFFTSQILFLHIKSFDNLIAWTLANAADATLK